MNEESIGNRILWKDRRSGDMLRQIGNSVLLEIERKTKQILKNKKGLLYESESTMWIARGCGDERYLGGNIRHWANVSWDQLLEVREEAESRGKATMYLFVTVNADEKAAHYWTVPASIVESDLHARGHNKKHRQHSLHIREENGRFFIGSHEITEHHHRMQYGQPASSSSVQDRPSKGVFKTIPRRRFEIPISNGESIILDLPRGVRDTDVARVQKWIELMADVLVSDGNPE